MLLEPRLAHGVNRLKSIPYYRWSRHGVTDGLTGAGRVATGVEQAEIRTPFRIMPSRQRNLVGPGALALLGLAVFAWGIWSSKPHGSGLEAIALLASIFLTPIAIFWLVRERRYFDPRNAYYIEVGIDEFALLTPDTTDRIAWSILSPFAVEETTTKRKTKYGTYESTSYSTIAKYDGVQIKIPLGDFATDLGPTEMARAHAMCAVLNQLRTNALNQQPADAPVPFQVPRGLVVAPMPKLPKAPLVVSNSVVRRL